MYVKLQSGFLEQVIDNPTEVPASLERDALLVYCGNFESMDGAVEVKPEHIDRLHDTHNTMLANIARLVAGDVPVKNFPPLQLDHSVKAADTVGRLVGQIRKGEHTNNDGQLVPALYGRVRVLGKENVEKVLDGRWTHLSIGADLEKGKFQELTITPFPAASDASMLSRLAKKSEKYNGKTITVEPGPGISWYVVVEDIKRGPFQREEDAWNAAKQIVDSGVLQKFSGGKQMFEKFKAYIMRSMKLSEKDAEDKYNKMTEEEKKHVEMAQAEHEKLKKYLTSHKKMTEEDAEKHLTEANVEEKKKLAAEVDEHEKKMAAESPKDEVAKDVEKKKEQMSAARESLTRLSTDFRSKAAEAQLTAKRGTISTRLSKLRHEMKITPAEVKKIDMVKLSKESDATIDAVLKTYENREPVIIPGMLGSKLGIDASKVYQQTRMSQLEAETRANMPLLSKTKLAKGGEENPEHQVNIHVDEEPHVDMAKHLEQVHKEAEKHMAAANAAMDAGNHGEAKDHMRKLMDHYKTHMAKNMGGYAAMAEEQVDHKVEAEMSALAESVRSMQNSFESIMQLAGSIVGMESK